jgi:hypothetical protein
LSLVAAKISVGTAAAAAGRVAAAAGRVAAGWVGWHVEAATTATSCHLLFDVVEVAAARTLVMQVGGFATNHR